MIWNFAAAFALLVVSAAESNETTPQGKTSPADVMFESTLQGVLKTDQQKCMLRLFCEVGANQPFFGHYGSQIATFFGGSIEATPAIVPTRAGRSHVKLHAPAPIKETHDIAKIIVGDVSKFAVEEPIQAIHKLKKLHGHRTIIGAPLKKGVVKAPVKGTNKKFIVKPPVKVVVAKPIKLTLNFPKFIVKAPIKSVHQKVIVQAPVKKIHQKVIVPAPIKSIHQKVIVHAPIKKTHQKVIVHAPIKKTHQKVIVQASIHQKVIVQAPIKKTHQTVIVQVPIHQKVIIQAPIKVLELKKKGYHHQKPAIIVKPVPVQQKKKTYVIKTHETVTKTEIKRVTEQKKTVTYVTLQGRTMGQATAVFNNAYYLGRDHGRQSCVATYSDCTMSINDIAAFARTLYPF